MPRRVKRRASCADTSSSSTGRTLGRASSTVTVVPYEANTSANSIPTAPAPMTTREPGRTSLLTAPFDEMTCFSSSATPGSDLGSEPVARMMALPSSVCAPSSPLTSTVFRPVRTPTPAYSVILFLRKRNSTPLAIRSATRRERCTAWA